MFKVLDRISSSPPDAAINEDAVGATMSAAWAIDGATGVSDRPPLVAGTTDAAWLAGELNAALHAAFNRPDAELEPALAGVEAKLRAEFLAVDRQDPGRRTTNRSDGGRCLAGRDFASPRHRRLSHHL